MLVCPGVTAGAISDGRDGGISGVFLVVTMMKSYGLLLLSLSVLISGIVVRTGVFCVSFFNVSNIDVEGNRREVHKADKEKRDVLHVCNCTYSPLASSLLSFRDQSNRY